MKRRDIKAMQRDWPSALSLGPDLNLPGRVLKLWTEVSLVEDRAQSRTNCSLDLDEGTRLLVSRSNLVVQFFSRGFMRFLLNLPHR